MRFIHAIALTSLILATVCAQPAAAALLTDFTVTPSTITPGDTATLRLVLTPVFDALSNDFSIGNIVFNSGDGQTIDVFAGGSIVAPLDVSHSFTYLTGGTFTPTATFAASETSVTSGGTIVADYFFTEDDALAAELTVLPIPTGVPEPETLALFWSALFGLVAARRRKSKALIRPI